MATTMKIRGKVSKKRTGICIKKHYRTSATFLEKHENCDFSVKTYRYSAVTAFVSSKYCYSVTTRNSKVKKKNKIYPKNSVIDSVDGHQAQSAVSQRLSRVESVLGSKRNPRGVARRYKPPQKHETEKWFMLKEKRGGVGGGPPPHE